MLGFNNIHSWKYQGLELLCPLVSTFYSMAIHFWKSNIIYNIILQAPTTSKNKIRYSHKENTLLVCVSICFDLGILDNLIRSYFIRQNNLWIDMICFR